MLLTLSARNKDYKEWSGFFVTLVLDGEFDFFPSRLSCILAEKHDFRRQFVRFYLGGGRFRGSNAYLISLQVPPPSPPPSGSHQEVHEKRRN